MFLLLWIGHDVSAFFSQPLIIAAHLLLPNYMGNFISSDVLEVHCPLKDDMLEHMTGPDRLLIRQVREDNTTTSTMSLIPNLKLNNGLLMPAIGQKPYQSHSYHRY